MEPNLLVGDRIFVSKYTYGYSKHSFPFSPNIFSSRLFSSQPKRGDVIVFKTPADNRTDYIKRLIGLPGDSIQFIDSNLYLNDKSIKRKNLEYPTFINCGSHTVEVNSYEETLTNGRKYISVYQKEDTLKNTDTYTVPENHYFFMGDNRDCSKDSRFLSSVGYVHFDNIVGKARVIFFSNDTKKGSFLKFWKWSDTLRLDRFFKQVK